MQEHIESENHLKVGDTIEYEDAYTGELQYGRIEKIIGASTTVRIITKEEAGATLIHLRPKPRCAVQRLDDGSRICSIHKERLVGVPISGEPKYSGPNHIRSWMCPVSKQPLSDAAKDC